MRKFTLSIAGAVLFLSGGIANAATATGTITALNPANHDIQLSNGRVYILAAKIGMDSLPIGERVSLTYKLAGGKRTASKLVVAASSPAPVTKAKAGAAVHHPASH